MPRSLAALACLVLALPAAAHADAVAPPSATPVSALAAPRPMVYVQREPKSPAVATALSLGVTAGGAALFFAGLDADRSGTASVAGLLIFAAGPSAGHAYAGRIGNPGLVVRAAAGVGGAIAMGGVIGCALTGSDEHFGDDEDDCNAWMSALAVAGVVYLGGAIYEIGTAAGAARAYNSRHGLDVQLAPTAVVAGDGSRAPGVALAGRF